MNLPSIPHALTVLTPAIRGTVVRSRAMARLVVCGSLVSNLRVPVEGPVDMVMAQRYGNRGMNDLLECSGPQVDWFRPDKGARAGHPVLPITHPSSSSKNPQTKLKTQGNDDHQDQGMNNSANFHFQESKKENPSLEILPFV